MLDDLFEHTALSVDNMTTLLAYMRQLVSCENFTLEHTQLVRHAQAIREVANYPIAYLSPSFLTLEGFSPSHPPIL